MSDAYAGAGAKANQFNALQSMTMGGGSDAGVYSDIWTPVLGPRAPNDGPGPLDKQWQTLYDMPTAYVQQNTMMPDVIVGLSMTYPEWPYTLACPAKQTDELNTSYRIFEFNTALAESTPHEATSRVLKSRKTQRSSASIRRGLALEMEHGFLTTPEGAVHLVRSMVQMKFSIIKTVVVEVMSKLVASNSDEQLWERQFGYVNSSFHKKVDGEIERYAQWSKSALGPDAFDTSMRQAANRLGFEPDMYIMNVECRALLDLMHTERAFYKTAGPEGPERWMRGPRAMGSFKGIATYQAPVPDAYDLDDNYPVLVRLVTTGEWYPMCDHLHDSDQTKRRAHDRDIKIYCEPRDALQQISIATAVKHSGRFDHKTGDLHVCHDDIRARNQRDMSNYVNSNNSRELVHYFGQMEKRYISDKAVRNMVVSGSAPLTEKERKAIRNLVETFNRLSGADLYKKDKLSAGENVTEFLKARAKAYVEQLKPCGELASWLGLEHIARAGDKSVSEGISAFARLWSLLYATNGGDFNPMLDPKNCPHYLAPYVRADNLGPCTLFHRITVTAVAPRFVDHTASHASPPFGRSDAAHYAFGKRGSQGYGDEGLPDSHHVQLVERIHENFMVEPDGERVVHSVARDGHEAVLAVYEYLTAVQRSLLAQVSHAPQEFKVEDIRVLKAPLAMVGVLNMLTSPTSRVARAELKKFYRWAEEFVDTERDDDRYAPEVVANTPFEELRETGILDKILKLEERYSEFAKAVYDAAARDTDPATGDVTDAGKKDQKRASAVMEYLTLTVENPTRDPSKGALFGAVPIMVSDSNYMQIVDKKEFIADPATHFTTAIRVEDIDSAHFRADVHRYPSARWIVRGTDAGLDDVSFAEVSARRAYRAAGGGSGLGVGASGGGRKRGFDAVSSVGVGGYSSGVAAGEWFGGNAHGRAGAFGGSVLPSRLDEGDAPDASGTGLKYRKIDDRKDTPGINAVGDAELFVDCPAFVQRYEKFVAAEQDPIDRSVGGAFLFSRFNEQTCLAFCEAGHSVKPFSLQLWRPIDTRHMGNVILMKGGKETGQTHFGHQNMMATTDVAHKMVFFHFTFYCQCVIHNPQNILHGHAVYYKEYISGHGCTFFTDEQMSEWADEDFVPPANEDAPDIVVTMGPYTETVDKLPVRSDLRGYFQEEYADGSQSFRAIEQETHLHYSSALYYGDRWRFSQLHGQAYGKRTLPAHSEKPNSMCILGFHVRVGHDGMFSDEQLGQGHHGPRNPVGTRAIRNGHIVAVELGRPYDGPAPVAISTY